MRRAVSAILVAVCLLAAFGAPTHGGVEPVRAYAPLHQPLMVRTLCDIPARAAAESAESDLTGPTEGPGHCSLALIQPDSGVELARADVSPGEFDALALFPLVVETPPRRALLLQSFAAGVPDGSALWVIPLWTPARYESALTALVRSALRQRSTEPLEDLLRSAPGSIPVLERQIGEAPAAEGERVFCGYRVIPDRRVRVRTSLGEMEFSLRYDAAPNHAAAFARLVEGGFYDGAPIHRLVAIGPSGGPVLVQMGDPTGTGLGGAGERIAHEASDLAPRRGILAMARVPTDPDSASGQLVIALSDAEAASITAAATAFGQLTRGGEVLDELARVPVGPRDPSLPGSPRDRPLANLRIEKAWLVDAPAWGAVDLRPVDEGAARPPVER